MALRRAAAASPPLGEEEDDESDSEPLPAGSAPLAKCSSTIASTDSDDEVRLPPETGGAVDLPPESPFEFELHIGGAPSLPSMCPFSIDLLSPPKRCPEPEAPLTGTASKCTGKLDGRRHS